MNIPVTASRPKINLLSNYCNDVSRRCTQRYIHCEKIQRLWQLFTRTF
jgi:hypothetical protein